MTFGLYLMGFIIFLAGVVYGMVRLDVPQVWIVVTVLVLFGIGIFTGATRTRTKDPSV